MNISFSDWKKAKEYADLACKKASEESNRDISWGIYEVYNGRKGIRIYLFDGVEIFKTWYSGICDCYQDLVNAIDKNINRAMIC